jgi:hypothetical protein
MSDQDFRIKHGLVVGNSVFVVNSYSQAVVLGTSSVVAGGSPGANGQVLTSNSSGVFWSTPTTDYGQF